MEHFFKWSQKRARVRGYNEQDGGQRATETHKDGGKDGLIVYRQIDAVTVS